MSPKIGGLLACSSQVSLPRRWQTDPCGICRVLRCLQDYPVQCATLFVAVTLAQNILVFIRKVAPKLGLFTQAGHASYAIQAAVAIDRLVIFLHHCAIGRSMMQFVVSFAMLLPPNPRNALAGMAVNASAAAAAATETVLMFMLQFFLGGFCETQATSWRDL